MVLLALAIMRTMPTPLNTTTMHASIAIAIAVTGCLRDLPGSWAPFGVMAFFVDLPVERFAAAGLDPFPAGFVFGAVAFLLAAFPAAFSAVVVAGIVGICAGVIRVVVCIRVVTVLIVGIVCGLVGALAFKLLFELLQRCRCALLRVSGTAVVSRQPLRQRQRRLAAGLPPADGAESGIGNERLAALLAELFGHRSFPPILPTPAWHLSWLRISPSSLANPVAL